VTDFPFPRNWPKVNSPLLCPFSSSSRGEGPPVPNKTHGDLSDAPSPFFRWKRGRDTDLNPLLPNQDSSFFNLLNGIRKS